MAYHEIMVTDSNKMGKIVGYNAKYTNTTIVHPLSDLCLVLAQFYLGPLDQLHPVGCSSKPVVCQQT